MTDRARIARVLYEASASTGETLWPWERMRNTSTAGRFLAMADAVLAAGVGADCLCWETGHTHEVLMGDGTTETRRLPKTHCPSCVDAALATARERVRELEADRDEVNGLHERMYGEAVAENDRIRAGWNAAEDALEQAKARVRGLGATLRTAGYHEPTTAHDPTCPWCCAALLAPPAPAP